MQCAFLFGAIPLTVQSAHVLFSVIKQVVPNFVGMCFENGHGKGVVFLSFFHENAGSVVEIRQVIIFYP
jgi:hypothetical protein